jgi:hypothetical protein
MLHLCWYYIFTGCYTEGAPRNSVPEGAPGNGVPGLIRVLRLTIVRRLPPEALSQRPRPRPLLQSLAESASAFCTLEILGVPNTKSGVTWLWNKCRVFLGLRSHVSPARIPFLKAWLALMRPRLVTIEVWFDFNGSMLWRTAVAAHKKDLFWPESSN